MYTRLFLKIYVCTLLVMGCGQSNGSGFRSMFLEEFRVMVFGKPEGYKGIEV